MRRAQSLLSALPHRDLASYLSHLRRSNIDVRSTTAVGTLYEYTVQASLAKLGIALHHTGGRQDNGIDLIGTWRVPSLPAEHPLRVLVQCKALQSGTGPVLIRELEGAFLGAPLEWRDDGASLPPTLSPGNDELWLSRGNGSSSDDVAERQIGNDNNFVDGAGVQNAHQNQARDYEHTHGHGSGNGNVIALLAATKNATKGIRDALERSQKPMAYIHMKLDGTFEQMIWNARAADIGLAGVGVTTRFLPWSEDSKDDSLSLSGVSDEESGETVAERLHGHLGKRDRVDGTVPGLRKEAVLTWRGDVWEVRNGLPPTETSFDFNLKGNS